MGSFTSLLWSAAAPGDSPPGVAQLWPTTRRTLVGNAIFDRGWIVAHHADTDVRPQLIYHTI